MIHLRNEGPIQPAPKLQGLAQDVSTELQSWPGMIAATHWQLGDPTRVDGAEFHVERGGELGHIRVLIPLSELQRYARIDHRRLAGVTEVNCRTNRI